MSDIITNGLNCSRLYRVAPGLFERLCEGKKDIFEDCIELLRERDYNPRVETAKILDEAYKLSQSVPYNVTLRWLFYGVFQKGLIGGDKKKGYNNFKQWIVSARKGFYKEWRPWTLVDDTRNPIVRVSDYKDGNAWRDFYSKNLGINLDIFYYTDVYSEFWFEAAAMSSQFRHYSDFVTLRPMKGSPSIDAKHKIAKELEEKYAKYKKPIKVFYFGDLDPKGLEIGEQAIFDIRTWCRAPIIFERIGINQNQVSDLGLIDNPDKPGTYQWESLSDSAAEKLITDTLNRVIDPVLADEFRGEEAIIQKKIREHIAKLTDLKITLPEIKSESATFERNWFKEYSEKK